MLAGEAVMVVVWLASGHAARPGGRHLGGRASSIGVDIGYVMRSQQLRIEPQAREHADPGAAGGARGAAPDRAGRCTTWSRTR